MKKVLVVLLAAIMIFSTALAGCKKNPGSDSSDSVVSGNTDASDGSGDASGDESGDASGDANTSSEEGGSSNSDGSSATQTSTGNGGSASQSGSKTTTASGAQVIDDELNDWNKVYEHGSQYKFEGLYDYFFENDSSRIISAKENCKDTWMTYKLNKIEEFEIITYRHLENATSGKEKLTSLLIYVSTDNKNWVQVNGISMKSMELSELWDKTVYTKKGIDSKYTYLKIALPPTLSKFGHNVGRVRINDIAHMYDLERFYEGRSSATFYVDSKNGNDNNDGKSQGKALKSLYAVSQRYFQPGDKILFKRGCTFTGSLTVNGNGSAGKEIVVGSYGSGALPIIKGRTGNAVTIKAVYVTVQELRITNPNGTCGLYLLGPVVGANKNITVKNCEFQDINTNMTDMSFECAAIYGMTGGVDPAWFDNLKITGNTIKNVNRCGVFLSTHWAYRPGGWGKEGNYKSDTNGWYPSKNVVVSNNTMDTLGGDGIVVYGSQSPVIEKNVFYRGYQAPKAKHSGSAGIWVHNCNDAVIQYNEVGYMDLKAGQIDGEAYNIDIANKRATIQYNYSHNNVAGFLLVCNNKVESGADKGKMPEQTGHTIRYNVSINDYGEYTKSYKFAGLMMLTGDCRNANVYNNTFYIGGAARTCYPVYADNFNGGGYISGYKFQNNIFHADSGITVKWLLNGTGFTFNNNIYSGTAVAPNVNDKNGTAVVDSAAKVQTVAFAGSIPSNLDGRSKALNVRLKTAVAGATKISNNGGKDFEGTTITKDFYGALQPK